MHLTAKLNEWLVLLICGVLEENLDAKAMCCAYLVSEEKVSESAIIPPFIWTLGLSASIVLVRDVGLYKKLRDRNFNKSLLNTVE